MNITKLIPRVRPVVTYTVEERNGRWLVIRHLPDIPPTVIEDCLTEPFARRIMAEYEARSKYGYA